MLESKYQIVTNHYVMSFIKKSQYFEVNLGYAKTAERQGERVISENDKFAASYGYQYKTTIYGQGKIGNIFFYVDYGILDNAIASYHNLEEFIFEFDEDFVNQKGISAYLGNLLKSIDTQYAERKQIQKQAEEDKQQRKGQADKLFTNPGAVTYDDIKAYIEQKRI